jgi:hypothetical protein
MSIETMVKEIQSATSDDLEVIRKRIEEEFVAAKTSDERAQVLAIFKSTMDRVERGLTARGGQEQVLADLKAANAYVYKSLVVQECIVGGDSPGGGDISVERLMGVTNREIAADRMTEDHSLRKIAVQCAAAPHSSHAELLAKHAKLQAGATPAPKAPPDNAASAYAFGAVLGRRLKGLFRR